jgi:hypothetical protein
MIDKQVWFAGGARPATGADLAMEEPSHIHIPRPSRLALASQGSRALDAGCPCPTPRDSERAA